MAKEPDQKENASGASSVASKESAAPKESKKVSFDEFADEIPAKRPPIAPESTVDSSASAIPEQSSKLNEENAFQERHLPEDDFAIDSTPTPQKTTSEPEPSIDSWAEEPEVAGGWDLDDIDASKNVEDDIFGSMAQEEVQKEQSTSNEPLMDKPQAPINNPLPPWQQGSVGAEAPELPEGTTFKDKEKLSPSEIAGRGAAALVNHDNAKPAGALFGIVILCAIGFAGYSFFVEKDDTTEVISRWTGSLNEVSEEIPTAGDEITGNGATPSLQPEAVVDMASMSKEEIPVTDPVAAETPVEDEEMGDLMVSEDPMPMEDEIAPEMTVEDEQVATNEDSNNTIVEFVDVPEEEVEKPIDAEGAPDMPEEVGVIVQLQQAIEQARKEKNPENFKPVEVEEVAVQEDDVEMLSPAELDERNKELSRQLEDELAEYRKILAGETNTVEPGYKPTPDEYFAVKESTNADSGSIPLPERKSALLSQKQAESLYGANPYNLPVVPEPSYQEDTGVRTLDDFDVAMFQVERERVRIPKNVRPSFRATNFPPLILLSTVPKKGIIAELNSKQGVLLIGESVSGWELLTVKQEYAEFTNGKRKHIVSIGR